MNFQRFMDASTFVKEIETLRAFRGEYMGAGLLETLESCDLLAPKIQIHYPDSVARRFWLEAHEHRKHVLKLAVEPDGDRWEAAVDLCNALYRWRHQSAYGPSVHPLDDPEPRFMQFFETPEAYRVWKDLRVEVSNEVEQELFDSRNIERYYTTWQALLAAELADAGIHIRTNLRNPDNVKAAHDAFFNGRMPEGSISFHLLPVHAARGFKKHESALNAVVWFAEECQRAFNSIVQRTGGGRRYLTPEENRNNSEVRTNAANTSVARHGVDIENLIALGQFLGERWADWNREGRPLLADAYKSFLGQTVQMMRLIGNLTFAEVTDRVGQVGGWFKPILQIIWPDWHEDEKERVKRTLQGAMKDRGCAPNEQELTAFVDFLSESGLEAFFWRLNSFEHHTFRGNEFALEGMKSDVQGMAIVVEHVAGALGATELQLYEKFKQLWRDPAVLALLKRGDVTGLARQARLAADWAGLKQRIEALRLEDGGSFAADLVMAHRIRGGVHDALPEDDQFDLEAQFVTLMRAAFHTFVEVRRQAKPVLSLIG